MPLPLPKSRAEIEAIQRARKAVAFERAQSASFHKDRLAGIRGDRLDNPEEWRKIPVLTKDELRAIPPDRFMTEFRVADGPDVAEFWRSGGVTGTPLFYARSFEDIEYAMLSFCRGLDCVGLGAGEVLHDSFPLGIHPVGHMYARAAQMRGIGVNWAGAGASTPSTVQVQLIRTLHPTAWMGMSSYALHLANLADAEGIDLAAAGVRTLLCSAEPISDAKRAKMERMWGAAVYDTFGMTEAGLMGAESREQNGFHIWTDMFLIEVLDPDSYEPVPNGAPGTLVVTPLWTNTATPFIRWNSGDIVVHQEAAEGGGPFSVFPRIKHAHRTAGFFKVRGVNINHAEFEDVVFRDPDIGDFKAEVVTVDDVDTLRLSIEVEGDADREAVLRRIAEATKRTFEVSPDVVELTRGTLAREFEGSVKAPRFVDRRE